ncbi:hypothetical protein CC1G_15802 [Coprinopsis cinerea okayama7|uniref:FHA domain-containing protein n=1 Tax=Coprinopsis cinerea (strain Okayama-7 / 130 / ATCC MYA-4618 / FGSC 9003) TaxID=240176 RepID=D6RR05_COPC7|nr:hypothetical protein CC1G_15802 [Coprinopsis cinerea okayama7\|eukprot:XP_002910082.1 hypothetical protein CC1G_15802 [Coprinopsis cinerea okayama7\
MWLLLGPFDGEQNDLSFTKTKLLKPDSKYLVGRKDAQILVRNKKISSEHGEFVVDSFSVEQAGTPGCRPTLTYNNFKKEWLTIRSSGREPQRNPQGQPIEVHSGDTLQIVNGITVQFGRVLWNPICCYSGAAKAQLPVPPESCASLGVNYTFDPAKDVTHHLISSYAATPTIATSLVGSAQFVTPAWLQEVVRLGTLPLDCDPSSGVPLEVSFALPPVSKYRPSFSPTLPAAQKDYSVWEPNEARLKMFHKFRFLCVGEKPREVPLDVRNLISKGEGSIEVFEVHSGVTKFQKALKRGSVKEGKTLGCSG